jgi:hypothetical protein
MVQRPFTPLQIPIHYHTVQSPRTLNTKIEQITADYDAASHSCAYSALTPLLPSHRSKVWANFIRIQCRAGQYAYHLTKWT